MIFLLNQKKIKICCFFLLFVFIEGYSQFYNKDIIARIKIEQTSEFYTFTATAENTTLSDHSLRYEFTAYKADANNNTTKSSQGTRFFIEAGTKVNLAVLSVNYSVEDKVTLLLMIYDMEDNPIGKDRVVLNNKEEDEDDIKKKIEEQYNISASGDQAAPQDGFIMPGLVIENTITKAGRDFYKLFYSEYYNLQITTSKNIHIDEVPGRMRSTLISVKVDGQVVWQFFTQPRKDFLKDMAKTAISRSIAYLQQLERQKDEFIRY